MLWRVKKQMTQGAVDNVIRKTYNIAEAAQVLGISKPKMYQICQSEGFPAVRLGARIVIPIELLDQWLAKQARG